MLPDSMSLDRFYLCSIKLHLHGGLQIVVCQPDSTEIIIIHHVVPFLTRYILYSLGCVAVLLHDIACTNRKVVQLGWPICNLRWVCLYGEVIKLHTHIKLFGSGTGTHCHRCSDSCIWTIPVCHRDGSECPELLGLIRLWKFWHTVIMHHAKKIMIHSNHHASCQNKYYHSVIICKHFVQKYLSWHHLYKSETNNLPHS